MNSPMSAKTAASLLLCLNSSKKRFYSDTYMKDRNFLNFAQKFIQKSVVQKMEPILQL